MTILITFTFFFFAYYTLTKAIGQPHGLEAPLEFNTAMGRTWAQYSPYHSANPYPPALYGCTVDQVNIIQRHGARFPTTGASERIRTALSRVQNAANFLDPRMSFLSDYTYDLGENDLIYFGARESLHAGEETFARYQHLVSDDQIPFVRSSGGERCVVSATNWTRGFEMASSGQYRPVVSVILSEEPNMNNTLDDNMCPNASEPDPYISKWLDVYGGELSERLNAMAEGATLRDVDAVSLMSLCPFETLAKGRESHFCGLFNDQDFHNFEYTFDVEKFYRTGYGQDLGPVQGVGYINELIARLTNSPVRDNTQTNRTLDSDPATFPLDRTIFADFSHDNQMVAIFSAIGLFNQSTPLDPKNPDPSRSWMVRKMVPFAGRMVTERLDCNGQKHVRILVNDALQPLEFCGDGKGLCTLDDFVNSQAYARNDGEGDFERCVSSQDTWLKLSP